MRVEVGELTIGDEDLCPLAGGWFHGWLLHAAKDPCHRAAVVYDTKSKLLSTHPEYLMARRGNHLFLNLVDAPVPIFKVESFLGALNFIDEAVKAGAKPNLHCNQGHSRAPSIALLWLAKRAKTIPDDSFAVARSVFEKMLPPGVYAPGRGIESFLSDHWYDLA